MTSYRAYITCVLWLVFTGLVLTLIDGCTEKTIPVNPAEKFEEWLVEHKKTCPACGATDGRGGICVEALKKLQAALKAADEAGWVFHPRDGWRYEGKK